ncbi:MAG: AEC family transporter [Candidatus Omnitrophota bacterium]
MELYFTFNSIAAAITKLFLLMFMGYMLHKKKIIDDNFTDTLSALLIKIIFPALIFTKIISHFSFNEYAYWWILPLSAMALSLSGMAIGRFVYVLIKGKGSNREFMCGCGFQNCAYLPMNLILFSFSGALSDRLLIYMFLFIAGFNLIMWSLVPLFLAGGIRKDFSFRVFLNPPVIATVLSIIWVAFSGGRSFPPIFSEPLKQLGLSAFPLAMITLGAYLSKYRAYDLGGEIRKNVIATCISKLIILPAIVLAVLMFLPVGIDYKFFIFLQSVMPTAVSLVVIGSFSGADNKFLSGAIFYSHLTAIFSIPLWFILFRLLLLK